MPPSAMKPTAGGTRINPWQTPESRKGRDVYQNDVHEAQALTVVTHLILIFSLPRNVQGATKIVCVYSVQWHISTKRPLRPLTGAGHSITFKTQRI